MQLVLRIKTKLGQHTLTEDQKNGLKNTGLGINTLEGALEKG